MVNDADTTARAAERRIVLSYAPAGARDGMTALLALDAALGAVVRTTREPLVGQMRLTWWHDALTALDTRPAPAEPVLRALAASVLPAGVTGAALATMIDGWERLFDPLDGEARGGVAEARGAALFGAMAAVLGGAGAAQVAVAGRGWALADLSLRIADPEVAAAAGAEARVLLDAALAKRWPRPLRALGALAVGARDDLAHPDWPVAGPKRVGHLLRHRLFGR